MKQQTKVEVCIKHGCVPGPWQTPDEKRPDYQVRYCEECGRALSSITKETPTKKGSSWHGPIPI